MCQPTAEGREFWAGLPSSYLTSEPLSLQSSLEMRNTLHSQVERCGTEKHRLWNSNLSSLTLAVWPWAIYLNLPEPWFPHLYNDVYYLAGLMWELREGSWICLACNGCPTNGCCLLITSRRASVVGAGLGNSQWFGSALLSDLPWFGPGSQSDSRGIPVPIPTRHHHQNSAYNKEEVRVCPPWTYPPCEVPCHRGVQMTTPQCCLVGLQPHEGHRMLWDLGLTHREISEMKPCGNLVVSRTCGGSFWEILCSTVVKAELSTG